MEKCKDSFGEMSVGMFELFACSMCYHYLFKGGTHLQPDFQDNGKLISVNGNDMFPDNFSIAANITNLTSRDIICGTLSGDVDCEKWVQCCFSAIACCKRQLSMPKLNMSSELYCPRTWDGYGCFDDTNASSRAYIECPAYVEHASTSGSDLTAYKDCTENGTWWKHSTNGKEWTNYSMCTPKMEFEIVAKVSLICNTISLILLILACGIFITIRQLLVQKRIRLHLCLFLSFILTSCVTIVWDTIVFRDRLENSSEVSIMHKNSVGCVFLYILTRYSSTCNLFWMSCEGFYLHRLIVNAFSPPRSIVPYYVFGWGGAWIPIVIYSTVRIAIPNYNANCWTHNADQYEWLMYTPSLVCLVVNLLFLANIMYILCSKLQAHQDEPSHYRRALKATFVLIPLLGITQFLTIYRPEQARTAFYYDIASAVINKTQGGVVALSFCFTNKEVLSHLQNCLKRKIHFRHMFSHRHSSMTSATQSTNINSVRGSRRGTNSKESLQGCKYTSIHTSSTNNSVTNSSTSQMNGHMNDVAAVCK